MSGSSPFSRRSLLTGLSAAAGSYFLPSLARAAGQPPKRLLVFYTVHGNPYDHWSMRRPGLTDDATWEFDLKTSAEAEWSRTLKPLYEHRDRLLILDTLVNELGRMGGHYISDAGVLNGSPWVRDSAGVVAGGPSFDQVIAGKIQRPGGLRSLELGVPTGGSSGRLFYYGIWQDRMIRPPVMKDPVAAYKSVFGAGALGDARAVKIATQRRHVLEAERARYQALAAKLSRQDRTRLESHADMMAALGSNMLAIETNGNACTAKPTVSAGGSMPTRIEHFTRIVTAAFACDITRVASIQVAQLAGGDFGHAGLGAEVHARAAHHDDNPTKILQMSDYYRTHAQHFANILTALRQVKEPDGSTLLDNTVAVWVPETGSYVHQTTHVPVIIGGGSNVGLRTGRYLHWASTRPGNVSTGTYKRLGPPVTRALVGIAQQMGVNDPLGTATIVNGKDLRIPLGALTGPIS